MAIVINFAGMSSDGAASLARELGDIGEHVTIGGVLKGVSRSEGAVAVELCDDEVTVVVAPAPGREGAAADPKYDLN